MTHYRNPLIMVRNRDCLAGLKTLFGNHGFRHHRHPPLWEHQNLLLSRRDRNHGHRSSEIPAHYSISGVYGRCFPCLDYGNY